MVHKELPSSKSSLLLRLALHGYSLGYLLLAAVCLIGWGRADPWWRFDRYSCSYLLLRILGSMHSVFVSRKALGNREVREEWWGVSSDPEGIKWVFVLMLGDLTVFLDYAHWRVAPILEQPLLQSLGLVSYLGIAICQMWTDVWLAKYFSKSERQPPPMDEGPYRYVRHPRYFLAIAGKAAFALIFASAFGWLMVLAWGVLLSRKIEAEEAHLRRIFGATYEEYTQRTAKLLPGVH